MQTLDAADERTDLAGWLHLLRLGLARTALWYVAALAVFAVVLVPLPGFSASVVASGSMQPVIGPGDVVVVRALDDDTAVLGRVVTFEDPERPGELVTHRIVAENPDGTYVTRGDANRDPDATPVARHRVRGRGFLLVPWIGLPAHWVVEGEWLPLALTAAGLGVLARGAVDRQARPHGGARSRGGRARALAGATATVVAVVAVVAPAVTGRSQAAYTAATANAGNNWATARDRLVDDDGGRPLFAGDTLWAGVRTSRAVEVTYEGAGGTRPRVRLAAGSVDGQLDPKLHVRVERGTRTGGAFPDAEGFVPAQVVVEDTTLGALGAGVDTGWSPSAGETATFRVSVWYPNAEHGPAAGDGVTFDLRWSAADGEVDPTDNTGNALAARPTYPDAVVADQPYLYYRFDDPAGRGTPAVSSSTAPGRLADGVYNSWVVYSSRTAYADPPALVQVRPNVGKHLELGPGDYVSNASPVAVPNEVTVEAWVRIDDAGDWGVVATFGSSRAAHSLLTNHWLYVGSDNRPRFGSTDGLLIKRFVGVTSPTPITGGGWHLLQGTVGADGTKLYVDGALVGSTPESVPRSYTGHWRVGWQDLEPGLEALPTIGRFGFTGGIDEVAVHPRALGADALRAHWAAATGGAVAGRGGSSAGGGGAVGAQGPAPSAPPEVAAAATAAPETTTTTSEPAAEADAADPAPEAGAEGVPSTDPPEPGVRAGEPTEAGEQVDAADADEDERALLALLAEHGALDEEQLDDLRDALVADRLAAGGSGATRFGRPGPAVTAWLEEHAPGTTDEGPDPDDAVAGAVWVFAVTRELPPDGALEPGPAP